MTLQSFNSLTKISGLHCSFINVSLFMIAMELKCFYGENFEEISSKLSRNIYILHGTIRSAILMLINFIFVL